MNTRTWLTGRFTEKEEHRTRWSHRNRHQLAVFFYCERIGQWPGLGIGHRIHHGDAWWGQIQGVPGRVFPFVLIDAIFDRWALAVLNVMSKCGSGILFPFRWEWTQLAMDVHPFPPCTTVFEPAVGFRVLRVLDSVIKNRSKT